MRGYNASDVAGWADYPDQGVAMGSLIGALNGLAYSPNLNDVGHGSAYNPGSISEDARALNFLGFLPDVLMAQIPDTLGRGGIADMNAQVGAFDPRFKTAVADFQDTAGLVVDGFIGPNTRRSLLAAVNAKNAQQPNAPASPGSAPSSPGAALTTAAGSSTGLLVGGLALAAGAAYAIWKYVL